MSKKLDSIIDLLTLSDDDIDYKQLANTLYDNLQQIESIDESIAALRSPIAQPGISYENVEGQIAKLNLERNRLRDISCAITYQHQEQALDYMNRIKAMQSVAEESVKNYKSKSESVTLFFITSLKIQGGTLNPNDKVLKLNYTDRISIQDTYKVGQFVADKYLREIYGEHPIDDFTKKLVTDAVLKTMSHYGVKMLDDKVKELEQELIILNSKPENEKKLSLPDIGLAVYSQPKLGIQKDTTTSKKSRSQKI